MPSVVNPFELEAERAELCAAAACGELIGRRASHADGCLRLAGGKPCALAALRRDPGGRCPIGRW